VWLSGKTGAAAAGLRELRGKPRPTDAAGSSRAVDAHIAPRPALDVGTALVGVASACIDVSDGLLLDLSRLARTSGVGFDLDELDLAVDTEAGATREDALSGGEDWVLAFTAPPGAAVPAGCIRIGCAIEELGLWSHGQALEALGFDHFPRDLG
jgi:thiamine-monophosphate kinase